VVISGQIWDYVAVTIEVPKCEILIIISNMQIFTETLKIILLIFGINRMRNFGQHYKIGKIEILAI